ncbi:Uncharacterised protein [Segatella copri]|nr:Uncharacterised protein [Segatella copri]
MPGEEHLVHGLRLNIFSGKLFQHLIAHQMSLSSGIELVLLQIITVFACQVAMGTRRLQHYIQWLGKGICYVVVHHFFLNLVVISISL